MKLPILDTRNTIEEQFEQVESELVEYFDEMSHVNTFNQLGLFVQAKKSERKMQLEALDLLTATLNLVHMLNIPADVQEEHRQKMLTYEHDVSRMYKIIKWIDINLEEENQC